MDGKQSTECPKTESYSYLMFKTNSTMFLLNSRTHFIYENICAQAVRGGRVDSMSAYCARGLLIES